MGIRIAPSASPIQINRLIENRTLIADSFGTYSLFRHHSDNINKYVDTQPSNHA